MPCPPLTCAQVLATSGWDRTVRLWHVGRDGRLGEQAAQVLAAAGGQASEAVSALAWSASGAQLAAGSRDQALWVWSVSRAGLVEDPQAAQPLFTADGLQAQAAAVREAGAAAGMAPLGWACLAWAPGDLYLASGGLGGALRVWLLPGDAIAAAFDSRFRGLNLTISPEDAAVHGIPRQLPGYA